jgi:hypothetical protein
MNTIGKDILAEMIRAIGRSAPTLSDGRLTGCLAIRGAAYTGELMIVGRAVNGWFPDGASPLELGESNRATEFAETVLSKSCENDPSVCSLRWVIDCWGSKDGEYNSARSAFWRVARRVLLKNGEVDNFWSSRLVWSNLYKIAPAAGGNPSNRLAEIELPFCRELLIQELEAFRPLRLVFATGADWADAFLDDHRRFVRHDASAFGEFVHGIGDVFSNGQRMGTFVIAPHPQGKDETRWVGQVKEALKGS